MTGTQFLPLPERVLPQADGAGGYQLQRAGERGYVVISGFVQATFVVTDEGVILVDAPPALDGKIQQAIAEVTSLPVTHFVYTHAHLDHVGAVTSFPGARKIAHEEAARMIANHRDPKRPAPDQVVDGEKTVLVIGGEEVHLIYPGPNHEVGNILVHFPAQKLSVMTDVVMPGWVPYRGWGNADYPPGMLAAHEAILATDFDTYVGGHVYRTGTRADVEQSRDFLLDTISTTQKAMGSIPFPDAAAEGIEPANAWAIQTVWFQRVADAVTGELSARWGTRLGGVDTFTHATVEALIVSLSTDAPVSFP
ncbi:MAG: MBL fold metallo-hydrolase [Trebonia sp.]|jgi:glyoxylase-like metal-dependent hydrolase (beta-lactamase superfamily II)